MSSSEHAKADDSIARLIDISAVQAYQTAQDVHSLARAARDMEFYSAHALPSWVPMLRELLPPGCPTAVGAPVGFPSGASTTAVKVLEARLLVEAGVDELDMVAHQGKLRSGDLNYVAADIQAVLEAVGPAVPVKIIFDVGWLDRNQLTAGCETAVAAGAAFIKTGTGWSGHAVSVGDVETIRLAVGPACEIKAAGGIRDMRTLLALREAGATRFGINLKSAVAIVAAALAEKVT